MLGSLAAALVMGGSLTRGAYGVPIVQAESSAETWRWMGRAVAEDRPRQLDLSRRLARGRLAEVMGAGAVASDRSILRESYTDDELAAMFARLLPETREALESYAAGVNEAFAAAKSDVEPWTVQDSMAIAIRLFRLFGRSGGTELQALAALEYLKTRPALKGRELDVVDDLLWQNDPRSPVSVEKGDDPVRTPPVIFPPFDRSVTERQLAALPKFGLLELAAGIAQADRSEPEHWAMRLAVPWETGSYAIAVDSRRSATGRALLLAAPQMGFTVPSIVHEVVLQGAVEASGMNVPGIPGVVIGRNPSYAWTLTTGVADADDVIAYRKVEGRVVDADGRPARVTEFPTTIRVKDGSPVSFVVRRIDDQPILLENANGVLVRRSAMWKEEAHDLDAILRASLGKPPAEIARYAVANFNLFVAHRDGSIEYRYTGRIPLRSAGWDPRFPRLAGRASDWLGNVPAEQMPHAVNPKSGLLTNWNNKPVAWWPSGDLPAFGEVNRVTEIRETLRKPKLLPSDLELAAWTIARRSDSFRAFARHVPFAFDGWLLEDSLAGGRYQRWISEVRKRLMEDDLGNFTNPSFSATILQPTVLLKAIEGRTKFDYRNRKPIRPLLEEAAKAVESGPGYVSGKIPVPGGPPIPYINRGTYLSVFEWTAEGGRQRSTLTPGVAESGPTSNDQSRLAREWTFKQLWPSK